MLRWVAPAAAFAATIAVHTGHAQSGEVTEAQQALIDEWTAGYEAHLNSFGKLVESVSGKDVPPEFDAMMFMGGAKALRMMALDEEVPGALKLISGDLTSMAYHLADLEERRGFDVALEVINEFYDIIWWEVLHIRSQERRLAEEATALAKLNAMDLSITPHGVALDALEGHLDELIGAMNLLTSLERWGCRTNDQQTTLGRRTVTDPEQVELALVARTSGFVDGGFGMVEIKGLPPFKTSFRIQGLNRRWNWGPDDGGFSIVIQPDRDAHFYDFPAGMKPGETVSANTVYFCTSLPIDQPDLQ